MTKLTNLPGLRPITSMSPIDPNNFNPFKPAILGDQGIDQLERIERMQKQQKLNSEYPLEKGPYYLPKDVQEIPNQLERGPYYPEQERPKGRWLLSDPSIFVPAEQAETQKESFASNEKIRRMTEILRQSIQSKRLL